MYNDRMSLVLGLLREAKDDTESSFPETKQELLKTHNKEQLADSVIALLFMYNQLADKSETRQ